MITKTSIKEAFGDFTYHMGKLFSGHELWSRASSRYYSKVRRLAYETDAEYRRIADLRRTDRKTGVLKEDPITFRWLDDELGWPEHKYQDEVEDRIEATVLRPPLHYKVLRYLDHNRLWPSSLRNNAKMFIQRGRRGFSRVDTFDLHTYLSRVIADSVTHLKEHSIGWPGEPMTLEEWDEILDKIILGFRSAIEKDSCYKDYDNPDEEAAEAEYQAKMAKLDAQFDEGFDLFKKYFFHLWD